MGCLNEVFPHELMTTGNEGWGGGGAPGKLNPIKCICLPLFTILVCISYSPRDEALLITRQRPKGLKVVSYPKFSIDSENSFLGGQSLRVLGEK